MKTLSIAVIVTLLFELSTAATDYCSSDLCYPWEQHVGCQNSGTYGSKCNAAQTSMVTISNNLKARILDSHNKKRNTIASGNLPRFLPAERMATMQWNDELALLASYNIKTCQFAHDQCRNTKEFRYSGQNLAKRWNSKKPNDEDEEILKSIDSWWSEYENANMSDIDEFRVTDRMVGHFTVMTAEQNIAVGCAAITFPDNEWPYSMTLACNYATTNIIGYAMYKSGATASKCGTGRDPVYPALCSKSEKYSDL